LRRGETIRGHEFHYSLWHDRPLDIPAALRIVPRDGEGESKFEGACLANLWASYIHLHFSACPELAGRLVDAAERWGRAASAAAMVASECGVSASGECR
jgi:cobyrinic acid a,c-diamide synthase